jgi:hypothetical protein
VNKTTAVLAALCLLAPAGCSRGGEAESGGVQSSPQEAANRYREAMVNQEWAEAFGYLTRKAQNTLVGLAVVTGAQGGQSDPALAKAFEALMGEHGLTGKDAVLNQSNDLTAAFVELVGWIETNLPPDQGGNTFIRIAELMSDVEYTDFSVHGDLAEAKMVGPGGTQRVALTKIDGRWYLDA